MRFFFFLQPQVQGGYIVPYYDQNTPILMAQGAAMRNGTPMRLVSPAPMLVPQQASRQTPAAASLYSNTPQSLYNANVNTSVNGTTLGGKLLFLQHYISNCCSCVCTIIFIISHCLQLEQIHVNFALTCA